MKNRDKSKLRVLHDGITATNAIDPARPVSGIVGKGKWPGNFEISEGIFKRELEEYRAGKLLP